jgi:hypothetical protein
MENNNLIYGKLPLEKDKWKNSKFITDGNLELDYQINNYGESGKDDFKSEKPIITYDLEKVEDISLIGIVFYKDKDNLKNPGREKRKYTFSLEISINGEDWKILKEEANEFSFPSLIFRFKSSLKARFIRFSNLENNINNSIHIVEIEVLSKNEFNFDYDRIIDLNEISITPSFLSPYLLSSLSESSELIKNLTSQLEQKIEQTSSIYDDLLKEREKVNNSINQLNILGSLKEFKDEAGKNSLKSLVWFVVFLLLSIGFFCLILYFLYHDDFLDSVFEIKNLQKRNLKILTHYVSRGLIFSFYIYLISKIYSIYKSEKHNYIINTHKAMSLRVLLDLRAKDVESNIKDQLLLKSMELILSHQDSGYSKGGESQSPVISSIIENIPKSSISN